MSRSYRYGYWYEKDVRCRRHPPRHWKEWQRLLSVAPHLKGMLPWAPEGGEVVPPQSSDDTFLALMACFADTEKREILTRLVFDLMYEDLRKLFISHCERMHGWQPQKLKQTS